MTEFLHLLEGLLHVALVVCGISMMAAGVYLTVGMPAWMIALMLATGVGVLALPLNYFLRVRHDG